MTAPARQIFIANEVLSSGTNGGLSTSGTQTRVLSNVVKNTIVGASLSSNQVTLPSGEYLVYATAIAYRADSHKAWLTNVTDTTDDLIGLAAYANQANFGSTAAVISGPLSVSGTKAFSITHDIANGATDGLGQASSSGKSEIFTQITIEKIG